MRKVLVIGAGMVAGPLVRYLLNLPEVHLVVADQFSDKAERLVAGHPRGTSLALDLSDEESLQRQVAGADVVVSMVPNTFHPVIARQCLAMKKNMVTTSYVGEAMRNLDADVRREGLVFLNEAGLDPGIDHMEAMRVINEVKGKGGKILSFISYCGGLPAPEAAENPLGYKFSWSPMGVLLASGNSAQYRWDGEDVFIPAERLFENPASIAVEGLAVFEGYPNRDSLSYLNLYGIPDARTMLRGTLRYSGWCSTLQKMVNLGLLEQEEKDWTEMSCREFLRKVVAGHAQQEKSREETDLLDNLDPDLREKLEWLGFLSKEPVFPEKGTALSVLASRMSEKMSYREGERDMIVLRHRFMASYPEGRKEEITSTLIEFGIPGGDSAMARTVGLPAAICTKLILERKIRKTGVIIPVYHEIYEPCLRELALTGIVFKEKREVFRP